MNMNLQLFINLKEKDSSIDKKINYLILNALVRITYFTDVSW